MKHDKKRIQRDCIGKSYLETNKNVSRINWKKGFSDNSSADVHERMQDGGKMRRRALEYDDQTVTT